MKVALLHWSWSWIASFAALVVAAFFFARKASLSVSGEEDPTEEE